MDDDENSDADSQASGSSGIDHVEYAPQELPEGLEVQVRAR